MIKKYPPAAQYSQNIAMMKYNPIVKKINCGASVMGVTPSFINFNKRCFGKIVAVKLPDLGEGTKEATIKEWYVKPGDKVSEVGGECSIHQHLIIFNTIF